MNKTINANLIKYNYGKFYVKGNAYEAQQIKVSTQVTNPLLAGNYYRISTVIDEQPLEINLPSVAEGSIYSIILFFTTGDSPSVTFTSEDDKDILYFLGFSIDPNTSYELNIMFNGKKWIVAYGIIELAAGNGQEAAL